MDHDQWRSLSGGTAGRARVNGGFIHQRSPASGTHHEPLDISHSYLGHTDLGQGHYAPELDLLGANPALGANLPASSPAQYHHPALNTQHPQHTPQVDPRQALAEVNDILQSRTSSLDYGTYGYFSHQWDPVAIDAPYLAPQPSYTIPSSTATPSQTAHSQFDPSHLGPRPLAPATWDGASIHSGRTSNSGRLEMCSVCRAFVNSRQMQRHHQDRHRQEGDPQYVCKCGYPAPASRKANHLRHLEKCKWKNEPGRVLVCRCGMELNDLPTHLNHIKDCGKRKAGRRPKNA